MRNFLSLKINYVIDETMMVLKDVLRKYPQLFSEFGQFFTKDYLDAMTERNGKAAFVWILGQFGEQVPEAPYILEKVIEDEADDSGSDLMSFLVVAVTRLFFKRAPEMKPILQKFYSTILKSSLDQDLKQRVVLYYRLLSQNIQMAEQVINKEEEGLEKFHEDQHSEKRERLFMEFNTLSVVYGRPSETFLKDSALKQSVAAEKKYYPKERGFKTSDQEKLL